MHIHRLAVDLAIQAPAKLNLFFEVLAKRSDGYHEIETLMCPIDLYDTLHFQEDPNGGLELRCRRVFGASGPCGRGLGRSARRAGNLVVRAVELVRRCGGVPAAPKLRLIKRSPRRLGWEVGLATPPRLWSRPTKAGNWADRGGVGRLGRRIR